MPEASTLVCSAADGCGAEKRAEQFARRGGEEGALCMACYMRGYRATKQPTVVRRAHLWSKYGITPEKYDAMLVEQDYRCAICGLHEKDVDLTRVGGRPRRDGKPLMKVALAVDHDHTSGAIRGLLCPWCNAGLGAFADNPVRLLSAAGYAAKFASARVPTAGAKTAPPVIDLLYSHGGS